jgi:hypothetical protein
MATKRDTPNVIGPRLTRERSASATCLDCGEIREDNWALAWAKMHAKVHGHTVNADYWASYQYLPPPVPR